MWFKTLYFIYITLAFLFPTTNVVGVMSLRHIVMLVMLFICVTKGVRWDKYLTLYTVFLFFFGLSSIITGYGLQFLYRLLGSFLQVYVFYFSTDVLVKEYHGEKGLYYFFLAFGLLDALVTIGQFYHLGFADRIINLLGITYEETLASYMDRFDTMEGIALQGLLGSVHNGYFLSAIAVLALYNKKGKLSLLNLGLWGVVMVASFLAQERMGFFVALLVSFIVFVFAISNRMGKSGWFAVFVFAGLVLFLLPKGMDLLQGGNTRYSGEISIAAERGYLTRSGWSYFLNNPMGAFFEYTLQNEYPHNVIVNMFLVGGLFGGVAVLILFVKQLVVLAWYLVNLLKRHHLTFAAVWGLMFLAYTINSLTHNLSIVLGTFEFFLFWSAFKALREREEIADLHSLN